uniref:Uncharacterized protein MANES_15G171100 n=1 Tax=Rhizophora mucronata TaxID=61149 RepID=A0A2P2JHU9_RHIMU
MEKSFTLIQTIATAGFFSAISFWLIFNSLSLAFLSLSVAFSGFITILFFLSLWCL